MQMRWRWPPENSCGKRRIASRGSRTLSISPATTSSRARPLARPKLTIGSAMMSRTRRRGLRLENGSWNTTCIRRRSGRNRRAERLSMRCPSSRTSPEVIGYRRRMDFPTVDLPQPLSPTRDRVSPLAISNETPSTAWTVPPVRPNSPPRSGKYFLRSLTSSSFGALIRPGPRGGRRRNGPRAFPPSPAPPDGKCRLPKRSARRRHSQRCARAGWAPGRRFR